MLVDKFVNGEYRGQIEVSDNGLVGSMVKGDWTSWLDNIRHFQEELTALGCTVVIEKYPSEQEFLASGVKDDLGR